MSYETIADSKKKYGPMLTVAQVANILAMAEPTVYEQLGNGTIPGRVKIGRNVRVSSERFFGWLEGLLEAEAA